MIAKTARIHPGVRLGKNAVIEDYCIIGYPIKNCRRPTVIGDNAHIRSHTVIYAGNSIGVNFKTGHHVNIRENNTIGNNVSIGTSSAIEHHICIEDDVRIHSQAFIPEYSILKKGCWLGPQAVLTNAKFPCAPGVKGALKGPTIGPKAKIGANVTVLPGVIVGENALVGGGSVVSRDIPSHTVCAGNPARKLRKIHY